VSINHSHDLWLTTYVVISLIQVCPQESARWAYLQCSWILGSRKVQTRLITKGSLVQIFNTCPTLVQSPNHMCVKTPLFLGKHLWKSIYYRVNMWVCVCLFESDHVFTLPPPSIFSIIGKPLTKLCACFSFCNFQIIGATFLNLRLFRSLEINFKKHKWFCHNWVWQEP
jgi:hypothetical protein